MRHLFIPLLVLSILVICLVDCSKENAVSQIDNLNVTYLNDFGGCFLFENVNSDGIVIREDSTYEKLGNANRLNKWAGCDTAKLPVIDFSKYTLLGFTTVSSSCDELTRSVTLDTLNKKFLYSLTIKTLNKFCDQLGKQSLNWVLVPRLPDNYSVQFKYLIQ